MVHLNDTFIADRYCNENFATWVDAKFMSCNDYATANWCTIEGQYGTGWNEKWGSIDSYAAYQHTAWGCPQCGCIG